MVSGNILASAQGGVGYLQPRGRFSSPSSSSSILQHLKVLHVRVRVCFVACILQHLKVNNRLQTLISQQLYTQSFFVFNTHPINRISKAGGSSVVNTISSIIYYSGALLKVHYFAHYLYRFSIQKITSIIPKILLYINCSPQESKR